MSWNTTEAGNTSSIQLGISITRLPLTPLEVGYYTLRILWLLFALFGNIVTIIAVITFKNLQTVTNSFVVSLAVADIMGTLTTPISIIEVTVVNITVLYWSCATKSIMILFSGIVMLLNTSAIAIDRFVFLHYPLRYYNIMTMKLAAIIISLIWLAGAVVSIPPAFLINHYKPGIYYCDLKYVYDNWLQNYFIVPLFTIVTLVTFALYIKISHLAYKKSREIAVILPQGMPITTTTQMKITKMMLIVIGVYFLCYTPRMIFSITLPHPPRRSHSGLVEVLHYLSFLLWFCSNWSNPLVYAVKNADFKKAFKVLLTPKGSFRN